MFISERHEPLLPFPRLPETVRAGYSNSALALRPFGLYESDLNVDFSHTLRPFLVTDVLKCCTRSTQEERCEQSFLWNLPVGKRIECLLTLLPSETGPEIPVTFRCPNQECAQELEVEISLEEITALQARAYESERVVVRLENGSWALRRPTGSDQLAWLKTSFVDQDAARHAMLRTLLLEDAEETAIDDGTIPSELFPLVERALEEFDPLVRRNCACSLRFTISLHIITGVSSRYFQFLTGAAHIISASSKERKINEGIFLSTGVPYRAQLRTSWRQVRPQCRCRRPHCSDARGQGEG